MVDRKTVLEALERIAPVHIAESWDNCGMQIDLGFDEIGKILVCLEITRSVIEEAVNEKADLIVTHHPLYFHESKNYPSPY